MNENLAKERRYYEELVGIAEDQSKDILKFEDIIRNLKIEQKKADDKHYFEFVEQLSKEKLKKFIQEKAAADQWAQLNTGIDTWK